MTVSGLTEEMRDYAEDISNSLTNTQIVHLSNILTSNTKDLDIYYGENSIGTSNAEKHASLLARDHQEQVEEFLHRDKNEWTSSKRNQRLLDDVLMRNGVSFDQLDQYSFSYTEYLLAIYHFYYEPDKKDVQNYDVLSAKTLLFHNNTGRTFHHSGSLNLQQSYLERKCAELSRSLSASRRNFDANPLYIEDGEEAVVKLYWERNRNPEMIFSDRLPDTHPNAGQSGITHRAAYPVKTITLKFENSEDGTKVFFSKSRNGWTTKLKQFFDEVFGIEEPFNTLKTKRDAGVDRVVDAVRQAAVESDEDEEGEDSEENESVFEAAAREMSELREASVEEARKEEGEDAAEELDELYQTIEPSGLIVENVRDTLTREFSVKSDSTLEDWMNQNPGAREIIESEVANAEDESLALRFRARLTSEDGFDEFVLKDGHWETESGSKVPEQTREMLDHLLSGGDE